MSRLNWLYFDDAVCTLYLNLVEVYYKKQKTFQILKANE